MRQLFISSFKDFKRSYRQYLAFEFIYLLFASFLFVPLISYILNRLFILVGSSAYLNLDIFRIVLDYKGAIGLLIIAILAVMFIFIELGVLIIISHRKYIGKDIYISDAIITTIKKIPKIFGVGTLHLIILFLLIIPFINIPAAPSLVENLDIPDFIREVIFESTLYTIAYVICLLISMYVFIRWIFALHYVIIENTSVKAGISESVRLTKRNIIRILFKLVLFNGIVLGVVFLIVSGIAMIPKLSDIDIGYLLNNQFVTISGLISFVITLLITPVNIIFLTRTFYRYNEEKGSAPNKDVKIYSKKLLLDIELRIRSFLTKRKGAAYLVICIYLLAAIPVNLLFSDSILNIGRPVMVAAHRGDPINAPENTISSIRAALMQGADFIEIDVQMTKDGVIVLGHDATLRRTTGVSYSIMDLTYDQIKELDAGGWFSEEFVGEQIPTLREVLEEVRGKAFLLVEIKPYGSPAQLAAEVVSLIRDADMINDCYIQSFRYEVLTQVRALEPNIRIGQVIFFAVGDLEQLDVDFYSVEKGIVSMDLIKQIQRLDREIWVWTVNDEKDIAEVLSYDIDGIITDYSDRVLSMLKTDHQ